MQYIVVYANEHEDEGIEDKVNALIEQGWKPQGGICAVIQNWCDIRDDKHKFPHPPAEDFRVLQTDFYQALVKEE